MHLTLRCTTLPRNVPQTQDARRWPSPGGALHPRGGDSVRTLRGIKGAAVRSASARAGGTRSTDSRPLTPLRYRSEEARRPKVDAEEDHPQPEGHKAHEAPAAAPEGPGERPEPRHELVSQASGEELAIRRHHGFRLRASRASASKRQTSSKPRPMHSQSPRSASCPRQNFSNVRAR